MSRLPQQFCQLMEQLGLPDLPEALEGSEPLVSVRQNVRKPLAEWPQSEPVAWCAEGSYLPERPSFTLDPRLHQGCYYVQEGASMFCSHVIRSLFRSPIRVLDACAAPGGKTTAAINSLPDGSVFVANEYVPSRAAILRENLIKWGYPATIVTRGDTSRLSKLRDAFDLVMVDAPCSGEGMMRKDEQAVAQWSPALIRECAERQWEIVENLWPTLRPGGVMIYSTCTFNTSEDEEIVDRIIAEFGAESVEIPVKPEWGITPGIRTEAACYRFIPGRTKGEGLFVAVLRKPGSLSPSLSSSKGRKNTQKPSQFAQTASKWLQNPMDFTVYEQADRVSAFPTAHMQLLRDVASRTDVIHEGVMLGNVKGRDLIPSQSLAMATSLNREAFPTAEMDLESARSYLRGEAVSLPEGLPKGFVLLTYEGSPLGFVKNLGNRSNNLYPQPWRIHMR